VQDSGDKEEDSEDSANEEEDVSPESEFPDTELKIDYSSACKTVEFKATRASESSANEEPAIRFVDKKAQPAKKPADQQKPKPGEHRAARW
jgi:hypothetical protein